jgi:hypothetical protein
MTLCAVCQQVLSLAVFLRSNVCITCGAIWRGPCVRTARDRSYRQIHALVGLLSVYIPSIPYFHDGYDEFVVIDGVKNSIISLTYTILVVTRKHLTPWRARVYCEVVDSIDDFESVLFLNGLDFLGR